LWVNVKEDTQTLFCSCKRDLDAMTWKYKYDLGIQTKLMYLGQDFPKLRAQR